MITPGTVVFCVALFFLFLILLVSCCYRQFKRSKQRTPLPPLPRRTSSSLHRRYITTIDVQTGLPVVVDIAAITAHQSQVNVLTRPMRTPSINGRSNATLYGSIIPDHPTMPSTPPPAYSEVYPQPRL